MPPSPSAPARPPPRDHRVLVVDRAELDRELLVGAIRARAGLGIAGSRATIADGRPLPPGVDTVVVRAGAPGTDLVAEVGAALPVRVVVVVAHLDDHLVAAVEAAGAAQVVSTATPLTDLLDRLGGGGTSRPPVPSPRVVASFGLTARELEVLHHLAEGRTPQQIARLVGVRLSTARDHIRAIREKLACATATEAVVVAHRLGLAPHVGRAVR